MIDVRLLTESDDDRYEALVRRRPTGLVYASTAWRRFLNALRPEFEPSYLGAFDGTRLVGALPGMIADGPLGPVFNSLPFYGSNGGVVADEGVALAAVAAPLFTALHQMAAERGLAAATIIESPLAPCPEVYGALSGATATDERTGQVTELPDATVGDVEAALMASFHSKTRNMVRKGRASGLTFGTDTSIDAFRTLHALHVESIAALGGLAKPWRVFEALREALVEGEGYQLYVARDGADIVSALLVLYYNRTAEYFTPVTRDSHRAAQPLSALILDAMVDATRRGMRYWNWGGTWSSQDGVYHFKARWGTRDMPYRYYVREYDEGQPLRDASRAELVESYPYSYVIPFGVLRS